MSSFSSPLLWFFLLVWACYTYRTFSLSLLLLVESWFMLSLLGLGLMPVSLLHVLIVLCVGAASSAFSVSLCVSGARGSSFLGVRQSLICC